MSYDFKLKLGNNSVIFSLCVYMYVCVCDDENCHVRMTGTAKWSAMVECSANNQTNERTKFIKRTITRTGPNNLKFSALILRKFLRQMQSQSQCTMAHFGI